MKIRVIVKSIEYGAFDYEGTEADLKANLDSIIETADEEGMVHWFDREVTYDSHKEDK